MATTPPNQITFAPETPSTPLHGPMYDDESPRTRSSARLRQKRALQSIPSTINDFDSTRLTTTPRSPRTSEFHSVSEAHSSRATPKRKSAPRVQIYSPASSNTQSPPTEPASQHRNKPRHFLSSTTIMAEGNLPTPVKTPKKNLVSKSSLAARALFQETSTLEELASSPRRLRKSKRYNGFSLESFRAEDAGGQIQIFTDSRDQIPEIDKAGNNPFVQDLGHVATSKKVPGTSKRRKVSEARPRDPQVEEAIRKDDGMVYVFRGRKVFRRFDDAGEDEEEEIDPDDIGLLERAAPGSTTRHRFKPLTRKSIKPTRLFQTKEQKRMRELEKEEEAVTDIEEAANEHGSRSPSSTDVDSFYHEAHNADASGSNETKKALRQKTSPFDSWPRLKPGSTASSSKSTRGRKRAISEERRHTAEVI